MSDKSPITLIGKAQLEEELKNLLGVERPSVIKAIEEARAHGDLSENAEYDAAKEKQALVEARINNVQGKLAAAEVVDVSSLESDKIIFGAHVELLDMDTDKKVNYQIVGEDEADVKLGKISIFSPLARSIIGKKKGDFVEFATPAKEREFEILKFEFK